MSKQSKRKAARLRIAKAGSSPAIAAEDKKGNVNPSSRKPQEEPQKGQVETVSKVGKVIAFCVTFCVGIVVNKVSGVVWAWYIVAGVLCALIAWQTWSMKKARWALLPVYLVIFIGTHKYIDFRLNQKSPLAVPVETAKPTIEDQIIYQSKLAKARQWKPPQLKGNEPKTTDGRMGVQVKMGGVTWFWPAGSEEGKFGSPIIFEGHHVVIPYVKDERVYVKVQTWSGRAEETIQMNNEWPGNIPAGWDRNFNTNSFEIVDDTKLPVLQVRYDSPSSIEVYGIFVAPNGRITISFGDSTSSVNRLPMPKIPERKAWFKYPSANFLGEMVD